MIQKKVSETKLTFLSIIISIFFGVIGTFTSYFSFNQPELEIETISNIPVFKIQNSVTELQIIFDGQDILKSNNSLSIITFKISNLGNQSIRESDFAENYPFTILVKTGKIVRYELVETSEEYLKGVFNEIKQSYLKNNIQFPKFILNPRQFMVIKFIMNLSH